MVGVLILVHEHKLKPFLVQLAHLLVFLQQLQPKHQQVIEIHQALRLFTRGVTGQHILDLSGQRFKPRVPVLNYLAHGLLLVDRQRSDVAHHIRLGETRGFNVDLRLGNAGIHQTLGIFAILNGKRPVESQRLRMPPQHAMANGVKRAAPQLAHVLPDQVCHAPHHFLGGLVGEGEEQNAVGRYALFQQVRHTISERARLARTRAGNYQSRARQRRHRRALRVVQLRFIIDLELNRFAVRLEDILPGHAAG